MRASTEAAFPKTSVTSARQAQTQQPRSRTAPAAAEAGSGHSRARDGAFSRSVIGQGPLRVGAGRSIVRGLACESLNGTGAATAARADWFTLRNCGPAECSLMVAATLPTEDASMTVQALRKADTPKDLYELGEIPPLGHVPERMYAWAIRKERHGPPEEAMQVEVVPTWPIGDDEVLVLVMAAGVNYNGVWAALGQPVSTLDVHKQPYHVAGSDASGIVWAVGKKVKRWKVGDEVVVHCNQDDGDDEECNGGDPMFSTSQRIWGYETPDGSFAQFCKVQARQLMKRAQHLTWEESASYTLTL